VPVRLSNSIKDPSRFGYRERIRHPLAKVLGDEAYESFARKGEAMTTAAMATYAYDQIDQARAALNAVLE
jgi:hypothetical protein